MIPKRGKCGHHHQAAIYWEEKQNNAVSYYFLLAHQMWWGSSQMAPAPIQAADTFLDCSVDETHLISLQTESSSQKIIKIPASI